MAGLISGVNASAKITPVKTDADGHLQVDVLTGGGANVAADESAFVAETTPVGLVAGAYTADTVAVDKVAALRIDANRNLYCRLQSAGSSGSAVPATANLIGGSDGTNLRSLKTDTAGQVYITKSDLFPGESASDDWQKVKLAGGLTLTTVTKSSTAVASAATDVVIVDSLEIYQYKGVSITWLNGAQAIANTDIQVSPNGTNWFTIATDAGTAASTVDNYAFSNLGHRYLRVITDGGGAGDTTVTTWVTANA